MNARCMKRGFWGIAVSLALVFSVQGATIGPVVSDDFSDGSIDTNKWNLHNEQIETSEGVFNMTALPT